MKFVLWIHVQFIKLVTAIHIGLLKLEGKHTMVNQIEKQIGLAIIAFAEQGLVSHKDLIVKDLTSLGVTAVNQLEPLILNALKSHSLLGQLTNATLEPIVKGIATQVVSQIGGEANLLYGLADKALHDLAKSLGGV